MHDDQKGHLNGLLFQNIDNLLSCSLVNQDPQMFLSTFLTLMTGSNIIKDDENDLGTAHTLQTDEGGS